MLTKTLFVALLAFCAVAYATEAETAAVANAEEMVVASTVAGESEAMPSEAAAEADAEVDKPKKKAKKAAKKSFIRPKMHPRGGLFSGHVKPFPVGYQARKFRRDVRYYGGGRARSTEQLLRPYRGLDRRVSVRVKGEERGPYPWETPEYEGEYARRTGRLARRPRRTQRVSLPVVHYPRGTHGIRPRRARGKRDLRHPSKPRKAHTPKPEGAAARKARRARKPRRARKARRVARGLKGQKKAKKSKKSAKKSAKKSKKPAAKKAAKKLSPKASKKVSRLSDRLDRLEKTVTFALRELGKHLAKIRGIQTFAGKGKKAIELIAKALQNDEKRINLTANQVDALRASAVKTEAHVANLHQRSKTVNALLKKHKQAIRALAADLVSTKATQSAIATLTKQHQKQAAADRAQVKANQQNVKALHTAALKFQTGILSLHNRELATRKFAAKQNKALKVAMKIVAADKKKQAKAIATLKKQTAALKKKQTKIAKQAKKNAAGVKKNKKAVKASKF